jgi:hypothetical protein
MLVQIDTAPTVGAPPEEQPTAPADLGYQTIYGVNGTPVHVTISRRTRNGSRRSADMADYWTE